VVSLDDMGYWYPLLVLDWGRIGFYGPLVGDKRLTTFHRWVLQKDRNSDRPNLGYSNRGFTTAGLLEAPINPGANKRGGSWVRAHLFFRLSFWFLLLVSSAGLYATGDCGRRQERQRREGIPQGCRKEQKTNSLGGAPENRFAPRGRLERRHEPRKKRGGADHHKEGKATSYQRKGGG